MEVYAPKLIEVEREELELEGEIKEEDWVDVTQVSKSTPIASLPTLTISQQDPSGIIEGKQLLAVDFAEIPNGAYGTIDVDVSFVGSALDYVVGKQGYDTRWTITMNVHEEMKLIAESFKITYASKDYVKASVNAVVQALADVIPDVNVTMIVAFRLKPGTTGWFNFGVGYVVTHVYSREDELIGLASMVRDSDHLSLSRIPYKHSLERE